MNINHAQNQDLSLIPYLRAREIGRPSQGSKLWGKARNDHFAINSLFPAKAINRRHYEAKSESEVFERIQKFASTIPDNQKGSFTCVFLSNPQCYLHIGFGYGNFDYNERTYIEEVYVLTQKLSDEIINRDSGTAPNNLGRNQSMSFMYALPASGEFEYIQTIGKIAGILRKRGQPEEQFQVRKFSYDPDIRAAAALTVCIVALTILTLVLQNQKD